MDMAARRLGLDPAEIRRRNMVRTEEFPFTTITGLTYDSGSNVEALTKALAALGYDDWRKEQARSRRQGRHLGIGIVSYEEMAVFGSQYWKPLGLPNSGYDSATVRVDPGGGVTLSVGTFSHGQGHATTYAQLVADELGVAVEDVRFQQGDTATTAYGWGTWGSRSAVVGGGAVIRACRAVQEKVLRVAAHLLEVGLQDLEMAGGVVSVKGAPHRKITLKEVAQAAVYSAWRLPEGEDPGLEATVHYTPPPLTFANATHAAAVEVDVETGAVSILRYVVAEDCGKIINPVIVAGQIHGGVAQGLGNALLEHLVYDENGQLLTTTLMDYLMPTAADVPEFVVEHVETPSPFTEGGVKGMGEGGAIAPPGCIANAIADALSPLGAEVTKLPLTPEYVRNLAGRRRPAE
jgi:carbon-monoxide dehydrogenase large subunit